MKENVLFSWKSQQERIPDEISAINKEILVASNAVEVERFKAAALSEVARTFKSESANKCWNFTNIPPIPGNNAAVTWSYSWSAFDEDEQSRRFESTLTLVGLASERQKGATEGHREVLNDAVRFGDADRKTNYRTKKHKRHCILLSHLGKNSHVYFLVHLAQMGRFAKINSSDRKRPDEQNPVYSQRRRGMEGTEKTRETGCSSFLF